jgi:cytochrome c oxidase subunit 1
VLLFMLGIGWGLRRGAPAGNDPWDGRTLEWSIASPPPVYNFRILPAVTQRDAFWAAKRTPEGGATPAGDGHGIHLPQPSVFPALCAFGMLLSAYGVLFSALLAVCGLGLAIVSVYGWAFEGVGEAHVFPAENGA